jgi:CRISPR/Cas system CSM-associated protein Csm2 small subunit
MKQKLTLSLEPARVAMLRRASARRSKSISELVEDLAEQLDKMQEEAPAKANILKWKGFWADKIAPEEFEADTRAGAELRKTAVYQRMKRSSRNK